VTAAAAPATGSAPPRTPLGVVTTVAGRPTPSTIPAAPTTSAPASRSIQSGDSSELAAPLVSRPLPIGDRSSGRSAAVVALAAALVLGTGGAVGGVGLRRLRA
ncbi:MAG: hypothetical protein M3066_14480, partial [Actinomycetota bacterium]|nr:hypothetical protein [Actinomycetota bacterium]